METGSGSPGMCPTSRQYLLNSDRFNRPGITSTCCTWRRVSRSSMILAHVRAASQGLGISEANCHPFIAGRYAFMHNGFFSGFLQLKRRLRENLTDDSYTGVHGTTDSEHLFARFRDNLALFEGANELEVMALAMDKTIGDVVELMKSVETTRPSLLNLAVTDGHSAVVSRFASEGHEPPSLYLCRGRQYICEQGVCRMEQIKGENQAMIVASEPLTDDEAWEPVPASHLLLIDADRCISVRPLNVA